ncbi:MAG: hypothetical protein QNJ16_19985 [Rhodobacter sp.]|nr:hypothetical protein [Rhodobacter sp.]
MRALNSGTANADLNGNGHVNGNKNIWPNVDPDDSGCASFIDEDRRDIKGRELLDIVVMALSWNDPAGNMPSVEEVKADLGLWALSRALC